jgi:CelD/BcsL family acetyltransferase involved in cellulose biosynthesis
VDINAQQHIDGVTTLQAAPPSGLTVHIVESEADLLALRTEWDELHMSSQPVGPFTAWAWTWHWWRLFADAHDQLHALVFRDREGVLRGVVPLVQTTWGAAPWRFRVLRPFGWNVIELRAPLIAPGWERPVTRALADSLSARDHCYDWCVLHGVPETGPLASWLESTAHHYGETLYHLVNLPPTWEELRKRLKRSMKKTLGHSYNTLGREGRSFEFEVVDDPVCLPDALDDFFRLHAARARVSNAAVPHPDHYQTARRRDLLRSVAVDLPYDARLLLTRLRVDGTIVATRLAFPLGDTLYLYDSGFEPAWWWYGVTTTLTAECMKMAIRCGYRSVNLSTGNDYSKSRWRPEVRRLNSWGIVAPSARAHAYVNSAMAVLRMRDLGDRWVRMFRSTGGALRRPDA